MASTEDLRKNRPKSFHGSTLYNSGLKEQFVVGYQITVKHLVELITELEKKKIGFKSISEAIDTTSSGGRLVFHIFGALAEFERNLIRERTKAGLMAARARGRKGGRPKSLNPEERKIAIKLYKSGDHSVQEVCGVMGISKPTLYSYLREKNGQ